MRVRCPKCNKALKVDDKMAGKRGRCPGCGEVLVVPAAGASGGRPAASPVKEPSAESVAAQNAATDDRSPLLSSIEEIAKQHQAKMDRAASGTCLGCLFTLLFFPVGIPLLIAASAEKRKARAESSKQLRQIKRKYKIDDSDLFSLAIQCPTLSEAGPDSLLPLIDAVAFRKLQEQRTQETQEKQRRREEEATAKAEAEAAAASLQLFQEHVPDETPDVIGVAYWSGLGSKVATAVGENVGHLVLGALTLGLLDGPTVDQKYRVGLVAVTGTDLYVVELGKIVGEDLTPEKLRAAVRKPSVRKAALRDLKATSRAAVLKISGELAFNATFPRSYAESNPGKVPLIEQAINAAPE
jgi:hypothetical protein